MITNEEKTLSEALFCAGLTSLPKENSESLWIKAIVKVKKCDNSNNYAIALNSADGKPSVIRDFGNMARIVKIENVYPFYIMPKDAIPDLRNRQDIIEYLSNMCGYTVEEATLLMSRKKADGTDKTADEIKADKETAKKVITEVAFNTELQNYLTYINAKK